MRGLGKLLDRLDVTVPGGVPMTGEAMNYATQWVPLDNSKVENELGLELRPLDETLRDTIRWLFAAGHISRRQAGRLAGEQT